MCAECGMRPVCCSIPCLQRSVIVLQDMVHLRRKNLVHGEDHHKYLLQGSMEESREPQPAATPAARALNDRALNGAKPRRRGHAVPAVRA